MLLGQQAVALLVRRRSLFLQRTANSSNYNQIRCLSTISGTNAFSSADRSIGGGYRNYNLGIDMSSNGTSKPPSLVSLFGTSNFARWTCKIPSIFKNTIQMLTSKDANFIGYTFKKSDLLKSAGTAGIDMSSNGTSKPPSLVSLFGKMDLQDTVIAEDDPKKDT
ncbi:hypothetical protein BUALT_Bualt01G0039100 [Buddleja alternifolia]|uniref:Uncharacterized protein n=1 Tax=Buddleja alternifolia TaxID=168488 RepID=A0AAV6Y6H7_9LAMI|nr:hypothetical protein BUALT_Bualt01G0039100 [Buddleja alternifolia]